MSRQNLSEPSKSVDRARGFPLPSGCAKHRPVPGSALPAGVLLRSEASVLVLESWDQSSIGASWAISSFGPGRGPRLEVVTPIVDGAQVDSARADASVGPMPIHAPTPCGDASSRSSAEFRNDIVLGQSRSDSSVRPPSYIPTSLIGAPVSSSTTRSLK